LIFGVSGKLLHNTLIMYDQQSQTLWSQLYGAGLNGPLAETTLINDRVDDTTIRRY